MLPPVSTSLLPPLCLTRPMCARSQPAAARRVGSAGRTKKLQLPEGSATSWPYQTNDAAIAMGSSRKSLLATTASGTPPAPSPSPASSKASPSSSLFPSPKLPPAAIKPAPPRPAPAAPPPPRATTPLKYIFHSLLDQSHLYNAGEERQLLQAAKRAGKVLEGALKVRCRQSRGGEITCSHDMDTHDPVIIPAPTSRPSHPS